MPLFAQNNGGPPAPQDDEAGAVLGFLCVLFVYYAVVVAFCLAHSRALGEVRRELRLMEPGRVWLALVPLYALVWFTVVALETAWSLRREFEARGLHREGETYGRRLWIRCVSFPFAGLPFQAIPDIGPLIFLGSFVAAGCGFVVYLVQVGGFTQTLAAERDGADGSRDFDDGYEDRPWERQ